MATGFITNTGKFKKKNKKYLEKIKRVGMESRSKNLVPYLEKQKDLSI